MRHGMLAEDNMRAFARQADAASQPVRIQNANNGG
jgi:hypothetical protein